MSTHADPAHPAIAAILALDLEGFGNDHSRIAAALSPHVIAMPVLRDWSCDDEWDAVEEACSTARLFVEAVELPSGKDPWMTCQNYFDRLRKMQVAHRKNIILDRLGTFPGYKLRVQAWGACDRIQIWPNELSIDLTAPILSLDANATRREVEIAIDAWNAGHNRGLNEGADRIRQGIRDLLGIEAA
ncbi:MULTISPECIES: hypothetical protein [Methylobacteriaceae]|uniref:hypothetical protein n=1 Tax=Methylobacteriaceae TaxID=119045 RepID=UPI0011709BFB|nr:MULTISPECIES: hypothetical protein [Methylobacteriaceae]GEL44422.1 hypothetical protein MEX01_50130 [Methylorubrum extorquens]